MIKKDILSNNWLHIFLSLLVLALSITIISKINKQPVPENSQTITVGKAIFSDLNSIPPESDNWKNISLPDDWFRQTKISKNKWYQFEVLLTEVPTTTLALYLANATRPVTVYINNKLIFKPEPQKAETARVWGQPQFIKIKPSDISDNKLIINIFLPQSQNASGLLSPVYIGPQKNLFSAYKRAFVVKVYLVRFIAFAMILSCVLVGMLWVFRQSDTIYAFYAMAVGIWAIYCYSHIPLKLPVSSFVWEWIRLSSMVWWSVSISLFCNRFLNSPQLLIEKALLLHAMLISVGLALIDSHSLYWLGDFILPAYATLLGLYPSYRMLVATVVRRDPHLTWLTMCGMMVMLLASHDIIIYAHWSLEWQGQGLHLHYAALVLLLVFNVILLKRFVGTLNEVEQLNKNLEKQVEIKAQELEENYKKLHILEREKVLTTERDRIMRDMHDGVGGTLVSMRAALERGIWTEQDVVEGLGSAQDDLYMMIHSLDPYGSDLAIALGSIRHILENRLRRADIKLRWVVKELPEMESLTPAFVLSVMRIMQESIANIIKHAEADLVEICIPVESDHADSTTTSLSITDNGKGIDLQNSTAEKDGRTGHGLPGMHHRAEQMGATVSILPTSPGTQVLLHLPTLKP
jgi:signal transduction histidine kinase